MVLRVGSKVKVKGTNNKGIILEITENSAKVSLNTHFSTYAIEDLEEEDQLLLDRLNNNDHNNPLEFILSMNAYRLLIEYRFNPYVLASSTKINIFPHQIDEVIKILDNPRMMIADEVGLGKTIIAALVATELRERGLANKILFVVPKSLVIKWQEELSNRFETSSTIINSDYLKTNNSPFKSDSFSYVTSMDFLKQRHILKMVESSIFDLVIVDEAHKLSFGTERFVLGKVLAQNSNFLLFLTATPHNGNDEDFLQRMRLLDPYFHQISTTSHLMTRNIKEDVIDLEGKEVFPPRVSKTIDVDLREKEISIHRMVDDYINECLEEASNSEERNTIRFLTTIIRKRASSSFFSLKNTLEKRIDKLGSAKNIGTKISEMKRNEEENDEEASERNEEEIIGYTTRNISKEREGLSKILQELKNLEKKDSKLELLNDFIKTTKKDFPKSKMVVFTEYRDTMNYLRDYLSQYYKIGSIDGTMNIQERNQALILFRDANGSEIMVCTDAAGEGIDMQFCNIEVNYDLPWNPNKLEQRMGRIHRIGQDRNVYYYNFVINDTIDGYIIHKLLDKMENIKNAIGDKIYDVIGKRLINEEEIRNLYEELLRLPKENWEAKLVLLDGIIEEKKRILNEINGLLLGYRLNRSKLDEIKNNLQNVIDKDEVKQFVEKFLHYNGSTLESIYLEDEVYKIFFPKQISLPSGGKTRILEGSFNSNIAIKKGYTYFALGNPYIMSLVHHAARPSVAILQHPTENSIVVFYKIVIRDRKGRERNAKIISFYFDAITGNIEERDIKDIWKYEYRSDSVKLDTNLDIAKNKELVDVHADQYANNLLKETSIRLEEIESKTEESIIRYYSKQIEYINSRIDEYLERISESPVFSKHIEKEKSKKEMVQKELNLKLDETKKDFNVFPIIELIGIAIIVQPTPIEVKHYTENPEMIRRLNEFSKQNQLINTENSMTTHARLQKHPEEWYDYHKKLEEIRKSWTIDPLERIIQRLKKISPRLRIGDFGCGKAKIMEIFGSNRVKSFDHIAINEKVTACDIRSVPLDDGYLDVIVFSLSLMEKNWYEYIIEASRCLMSTGTLIIADTVRSLTEGRLNNLKEVLIENGFEVYKEELWDIFSYIEARKK